MSHNHQKKIAVINDFCGFGRCSIAAALPIISAMRVQCCPLPTSIFSNHTGFDSFYYTDFTKHMNAYMDEWSKLDLHFNGILTGFLGSPEQIDIVTRFLNHFKTKNTVAVIDPVNATNKEDYFKTVRPKFGIGSYDAMLRFAKECVNYVPNVVMTVVDVVTSPEEQEYCREICNSIGASLRIRPYEE